MGTLPFHKNKRFRAKSPKALWTIGEFCGKILKYDKEFEMQGVNSMSSENKTLGAYQNGFFSIDLNVNLDFTNLHNSDNIDDLGTLFHEYIHYFQDISTTYGLFNISSILFNLAYCIKQAQTQGSSVILIPFSKNEETHDLLVNIRSFTYGSDAKWTYEEYKNIRILSVSPYTVNQEELADDKIFDIPSLPELELELTDYDGNVKVRYFSFGALAVMESMANIIEKHLYAKAFSRKGLIPQYDLAELLFKFIYNDFCENKANLIALLETSLMHYNPGKIFYESLVFFKELYQCENEFRTRNYKFISDIVCLAFEINKIELINKAKESLFLQIDLLFSTCDFYEQVNHYLKELLAKAIKTFHQDGYSLSELGETQPDEARKELLRRMKDISAPLIISNMKDAFSSMTETQNKANMLTMKAAFAILKILSGFSTECDMIGICTKRNPSIVDHDCTQSPWVKFNGNCFCEVACLWSSWGLDGKTIKHK